MDKESVSLSSEISVTGLLTLSKILLSANIVFVSCHLTTFGSGGVAYAKMYIYNWVFFINRSLHGYIGITLILGK